MREEIENLPYLCANMVAIDDLIHKNIIDLMLQVCPDDFEPIPVKIISANKNVKPFELNNYYTINILKGIKAIDESNPDIDFISTEGMFDVKNFRYKDGGSFE